MIYQHLFHDLIANTSLMDNMNIGKAITQGYNKSKPSWILTMCSLILRVFEHYSFSEQRFLTLNVVELFYRLNTI